ncbi:MAG: hypothetical protein WKG52_10800 [Variovorax sp.]
MTQLPQLDFRQRIQVLLWGRRLLWPAGLVVVAHWRTGIALTSALMVGLVLGGALKAWEMSARRQFVREATFPRFLGAKLRAAYPQLQERDTDLVLRGLRQFFMAHLRSDRKFVAMPSKVVDAAWHEFILHTQGYQRWCAAAFGKLMHHTPAEVLGSDARRNDGLRRTWYWACKEESIDPRKPTRLPLLFALDAKFGVAGGFQYVPDCKAIDEQAGSGTHCGSSFSESDGGSGDASGFGGSESSGGDGGGDSGCGGGGD